ncbi:ankyrin repeat-containing domain protein [Pavlovales sp. CCMP2436]|nr:ankyrin repeat-containing domain protein [Pavlovales sp. CCMP2436]
MAITDYEVLSKIGEGGFGTVLLVRKRRTGKLYALKVLVKKNMDSNHIYFVLEFVGGGDLYSHLERQTFPEEWAQIYIAEIAMAIAHVHSHDFVYRDLKPENILGGGDGSPRIAGDGNASANAVGNGGGNANGNGGGGHAGGTGVAARGRLNTMIGMLIPLYSLNCRRTLQMLALPQPSEYRRHAPTPSTRGCKWGGVKELLLKKKLLDTFVPSRHPAPSLSKEAADLIKRLLTVPTAKRMCCGPEGFEELKKHPFFKGMDWDKLYRRELEAPLKPLLAPGGISGMQKGAGNTQQSRIADREADMLEEEFGLYMGEDDSEALGRYAASAALCEAAAHSDLEGLKTLIDNGTDVNGTDYDKLSACAPTVCVPFASRWGGTPLDDAIRSGHEDVQAYLREKGATAGKAVEAASVLPLFDGTAELIDAAFKGELERVRELSQKSNVDVNAGDYDRRTAIHLAASEGLLSIVEFLVDEAHASVNPVDRWGGTPLDDAVRAKHVAVARFLKVKGGITANKLLEKAKSKDHSLSLCDAAAQGNAMAIRVLVAQGADVSQGDYDKRTALHLAASNGHLEMVRILIRESKADVNPVDRWGGTPADDAIRSKHQEVADYLLRHGGKRGTRLDATIADLCQAAAKGDVASMREFVKQGVDPNTGDYDKRTPMHLAASEGLLKVVQFLLDEGGAKVSPVDRWGGTPLDDAIRHKKYDVVELLLARGGISGRGAATTIDMMMLADDEAAHAARGAAGTAANAGTLPREGPLRLHVHAALLCSLAGAGKLAGVKDLVSKHGFSADLADYDKRTAMHLAASEGHIDVVRFLIETVKADLACVDRFGHTALDEAVLNGRAEVAAMLRGAGAKSTALSTSQAAQLEAAAAALCAAASRGDVGTMRELLKLHGPALAGRADYDGRRALHIAASEGKLDACRLLVEAAKVDSSPGDRWAGTPLDDAERFKHADVVTFLLSVGARHGAGRAHAPCFCVII